MAFDSRFRLLLINQGSQSAAQKHNCRSCCKILPIRKLDCQRQTLGWWPDSLQSLKQEEEKFLFLGEIHLEYSETDLNHIRLLIAQFHRQRQKVCGSGVILLHARKLKLRRLIGLFRYTEVRRCIVDKRDGYPLSTCKLPVGPCNMQTALKQAFCVYTIQQLYTRSVQALANICSKVPLADVFFSTYLKAFRQQTDHQTHWRRCQCSTQAQKLRLCQRKLLYSAKYLIAVIRSPYNWWKSGAWVA